MSEAHVVYFFTHDSVGLGEDGPTHQPIEHLASLRAMPNLRLIRPADANETAAGLAHRRRVRRADGARAHPSGGPGARTDRRALAPHGVARGGYVLVPGRGDGDPDVVLIGTGSEVQHCVAAGDLLATDGLAARVVSLPSWDLFALQGAEYRDEVLPPGVPRLSVEAGSSFGWERYADAMVSIDRFGASAPGSVNMEKFGFTADNVAARARELLAGRR